MIRAQKSLSCATNLNGLSARSLAKKVNAASAESQSSLGEEFAAKPEQQTAGKKTRIAEHERNTTPKDGLSNDESALFFDESKVPVETIYLDPETATGLNKDEFEVISEKVTYRLSVRLLWGTPPNAQRAFCRPYERDSKLSPPAMGSA